MIAKKKVKKKTSSKRDKKVHVNFIPSHVLNVIKCAIVYERTIAEAVQNLKILYPVMSTHSAGLALALSALTYPDQKTFASMISDMSPNVLTDYKTIRPFLDDAVPSKGAMH